MVRVDPVTAVITTISIRGAARYRAECEKCMDGRERAKRAPVKAWADEHNRTYHPAPGAPDSDPGWGAYIQVMDTPERDNPASGSVQIRTSRNNTTNIQQMTRADALDLQRALTHYLKAGTK